MRPAGQQTDLVRVGKPPPPFPRAFLRHHGMAGAIMAFYVFGLMFLQLGLMKFGKKSAMDSC